MFIALCQFQSDSLGDQSLLSCKFSAAHFLAMAIPLSVIIILITVIVILGLKLRAQMSKISINIVNEENKDSKQEQYS